MSYYYDRDDGLVCNLCGYTFCNFYGLSEHQKMDHAYCEGCDLWFTSARALKYHKQDSRWHNHCGVCGGDFSTPAALRGHEQVHLPKNMKCPLCPSAFSTASAVAKHLEQARCHGNLTRLQFVEKVHEWEMRTGNPNLFTTPRLGSSSSDCSGDSNCYATIAAWNGYGFACYFCPKQFFTLFSLNQHLQSGVHAPRDFGCMYCGFTAVWMSALIAHIESEKCVRLLNNPSRGQVFAFTQQPFSQLRLQN